jgi:hypothetical protein
LPAATCSAARHRSTMAGFDASFGAVVDGAGLREVFVRFLRFVFLIAFSVVMLGRRLTD